MDIRPLWIKVLIAISLLFLAANLAEAVDGNAVGGSVSSADTDLPLGYVDVIIAQDTNVKDQTREPDGLYTLKVPTSRRTFDLLYQKPGYLDAHDEAIQNDKQQQKRPIAKMTPIDAVKNLPSDELEKLVTNAVAAIQRGETIGAKILIDSGKKNLELLDKNIDPLDPRNRRIRVLIRRHVR